MNILVINAGSSTVKLGVFEADGRQSAFNLLETNEGEAVVAAIRALCGSNVEAVGHRIVHGGEKLRQSVVIDVKVRRIIEELAELAPLHNPPGLAAIEAAQRALPNVPHVAVFDTAFFADLPERAYIYPVPYSWYEDWRLRRYGFHGISHSYCADRAAEMLARPLNELRLVICHLGNGCSAAAVAGRKARATTMGFSPLDGLMMGTRGGSIDPAILLHVMRQRGINAEQLDGILNHQCGLLGVSGISADFREVEKATNEGHARARLALDIYAERVRAAIGSLAATIGGVDALVFTAGVGEHSASLRSAACEGLECLGLHLDGQLNAKANPDADIGVPGVGGRILVIHTREEYRIAQEVRRLICQDTSISRV